MKFKRMVLSIVLAVSVLPMVSAPPAVPAVSEAALYSPAFPFATGDAGQASGSNETASVPNVVAGRDGQPGRGFAIAETAAGAFNRDGYIILDLPDSVWFAAIPKVEVTAGDLRVGNVRSIEDGSQVLFKIEAESTEPSTISVSGVLLNLDRTVAEGDITLKIMGGAVVETQSFVNWTNSDYAVGLTIAKVVSPAPAGAGDTAVFTIGDMEYYINEVQSIMDAAPFIDTNGRAMLPVRFAANAAGISDSGIFWNEAGRSVTLVRGNRIVKLVVGSATMTINGVPFEMDTVPVIADTGRVMLPVRSVAQALGCEVTWDEVARTVTVSKTN